MTHQAINWDGGALSYFSNVECHGQPLLEGQVQCLKNLPSAKNKGKTLIRKFEQYWQPLLVEKLTSLYATPLTESESWAEISYKSATIDKYHLNCIQCEFQQKPEFFHCLPLRSLCSYLHPLPPRDKNHNGDGDGEGYAGYDGYAGYADLMLMFMCCDGYDGILENSLDNVGSLQRSEGEATRQSVSRSVWEWNISLKTGWLFIFIYLFYIFT